MDSAAMPKASGAEFPEATWWQGPDRTVDSSGHLHFGGHPVSTFTGRTALPAYFYSASRIRDNVTRLRLALASIGAPTRLYYAMKANRFPPVLSLLRGLGLGVDVCSPGEVRHALALGYTLDQLSFTSGSLSSGDYAALAAWPALWVNADSLTSLRRLGAVSPGRELGLRINPAAGLGYRTNPLLTYSGTRPTKFGVYFDRFEEALALARQGGLCVTGLHCHAGCGFLTPQLPLLDGIFSRIGRFLDAAPEITRINLGGGLGIPLAAGDEPLDLAAWAALVRRHFEHRSLTIEFEPGDYLVKDAGLLLAEVTQVEEKGGRVFVGVNAGFNVHIEPAFYQLPLIPVPAASRPGPTARVTVVGNINEALDVWAADIELPPLAEGDQLAFLNAGGYGASMASAHCLRTEMTEHLLPALPSPAPADLDRANQAAWEKLYASTPDLVWGQAPLPFLAEFSADLRARFSSPARVLDAGTGEGRNLPFLLALGAAEVHALDSSVSGLAKIPSDLHARISPRLASLDNTGYDSGYFDAIILLDVVETLPDLGAVLREMARVLKPGGQLLCNIPGLDDGVVGIDMEVIGPDAFLYQHKYYYHFIAPRDAASLLAQTGFEVIRSCRCQWSEASHPGFRPREHQHVSEVFLVRPIP